LRRSNGAWLGSLLDIFFLEAKNLGKDTPMNASPVAKTYREQAELCFRLADMNNNHWMKSALQRHGADMLQIAQDLELSTKPTPRFYAAA
jgi:hypothetical protein